MDLRAPQATEVWHMTVDQIAGAKVGHEWLVSRDAFNDEARWRQELETVFRKAWLLVGHESEVRQIGDYVTRRMASDEVVLTRAEDGALHVLLNACTHRGTLLCKADRGNTRHFRCGYHGWTFGNDGELRGVPGRRKLYGDDFDEAELGMRRARVGNYRGLIFATFDSNIDALEDYLGDVRFYLDCFLDPTPNGTEAVGGSYAFTRHGNWKTAADNISGDGYHLRHAHRFAFELGIMGGQAGEVDGSCIQIANGHALRAQHIASQGQAGQRFPGYPESLWPEISRHLEAEQANFLSDLTVAHGLVFPSMGFLHVPRAGGLEKDEFEAAALNVRVFNPISPNITEERAWTIVPADYPADWKQQACRSMQRQHGPTAFFEADDMENFQQIARGGAGRVANELLPARYDLAMDHAPHIPWFDGPGNVVGADLSEANQRWFYSQYLERLQ